MADFLRVCNTGELRTDGKTFTEFWCAMCHRPDCDLALLAKTDPMAHRNATWREKFFGTPQANLAIPRFARIAQTDFPNLLQKAMKLEISARRGDWSVPEIPILDGRAVPASKGTTDQVEAAARQLAGKGPPVSDLVDEKPVQDLAEEDPDEDLADEDPAPDQGEDDPPPPPPSMPRGPQPPVPQGRNTLDPGEVMIGGGPAPVPRSRPVPEQDPWAAPAKPTTVVIKPGATIKFGSDGR